MSVLDIDQETTDFLYHRSTPDRLGELYDPKFVRYRHSILMGLQLRRLLTGKEPNQMWSWQPQIGKSEMAVRKFPTWAFDWYPDLRIVGGAYGAQLAQKSTRYVRNIGREFGGSTLRWQLDPTRQTQHEFYTTEGGSYLAVGVGGPIIGNPADIALLDDLHKNWEEAHRPKAREDVWNWVISDVQSRLQDDARVLIVTTRWHPDDVIGRMLEYDAWDFSYLHVPAIADSTIVSPDPLDREDGEVVEPRRFRRSTMIERRRRAGPFIWNALYQGVPSLAEGGIFRRSWFEFIPAMPRRFEALANVTSWDLAFADGEDGSYVVGQAWQLTADSPHQFVLYDQVRGRWDYPSTRQVFLEFIQKHPECDTHLIENAANGHALAAELRRTYGMDNIVTISPPAGASKRDRGIRVSPLVADGRVKLPQWVDRHDWIDPFLTELSEFDNSAHDDQVDAFTQALMWLDRHASTAFGRANTVDDERLFGRR